MPASNAEHESVTLAMVRRTLAEQADSLAQAGLVPSEPRVTRTGTGATAASSEAVVEFMANDDIVDVIEFDLLRDGKPATSLAEAERWIRAALADVVRRQVQAR